jgi:hypothetical protein
MKNYSWELEKVSKDATEVLLWGEAHGFNELVMKTRVAHIHMFTNTYTHTPSEMKC